MKTDNVKIRVPDKVGVSDSLGMVLKDKKGRIKMVKSINRNGVEICRTTKRID